MQINTPHTTLSNNELIQLFNKYLENDFTHQNKDKV